LQGVLLLPTLPVLLYKVAGKGRFAMQNRFSIGEMSRLMNIPVKTLRYYDEIGLFKPIEVNRSTGYRYYSTEQFEQVDIIKYLRLLGVPLAEIKAHFTHRRVEYFLDLLRRQEEFIRVKIQELEQTRRRFGSRVEELEQTLTGVKADVMEIRVFPDRQILRLQESVERGPGLEMTVRKLEKLIGAAQSPIFIGKVGLTVSPENLQEGRFQEYNSVFIVVEEPIDQSELSVLLPAGEYACGMFRGGHADSPEPYRRLLQFIEQQGYLMTGEAIERAIIDEFIDQNNQKFRTEIQIPVRKCQGEKKNKGSNFFKDVS
jgi:DNA-binding transcriptional MerR regulator